MKEKVVLLVLVEANVKTEVREGGRIVTKSATQAYRDNFDAIFPKKEEASHLN